jgi:hypothetical protein
MRDDLLQQKYKIAYYTITSLTSMIKNKMIIKAPTIQRLLYEQKQTLGLVHLRKELS